MARGLHDGYNENESRKTVLVVDDEPVVRRLVRLVLSRSAVPLEVIEAGDGWHALNLVQGERPDLALLDVFLPGLDGSEVCRLLKANPLTSATPVILVSVEEEESLADLARTVGADGYLAKPFSPRQLAELVERLVSG